MKTRINRECDKCGRYYDIDCMTGLCESCEKEENDKEKRFERWRGN